MTQAQRPYCFSLSPREMDPHNYTAHIYTKWTFGKCSSSIYLVSTLSYWVMIRKARDLFLIVGFNLLFFKKF